MINYNVIFVPKRVKFLEVVQSGDIFVFSRKTFSSVKKYE